MKDKKALRLLETMIEQLARSTTYEAQRDASHDLIVRNTILQGELAQLKKDMNEWVATPMYTPSEEEQLHGHKLGTGAEK